jgi:hypothetical protein
MKHEGVFHGTIMPHLFGSLRGALVTSLTDESVASQPLTEELNINEARARIDIARAEATQSPSRLTFA